MKTICFWCGKSHDAKVYLGFYPDRKNIPLECRAASNKANKLLKSGVQPWVLMRILEVKGISALWNFESAALEIFPMAIENGLKKLRMQNKGK